MMAQRRYEQEQLFYSFCLDDAVPADHPVRAIAAVLDLSWVYADLASYYPRIGRPSIDPVLMIRMLIVGYAFAIRSERALCREVQVNFAYRWFCGLSIEDKVPDHSAFSRARNERFGDSAIFRSVFERVVGACIAAGLVGGEGFAVDASLIEADANKHRSIPGFEWQKTCDRQTASRAMQEYLATLDDAAFGAASDVSPKFVSPSDPAAQWTNALRGSAFFAYADNYLIDVKFGIIMDVEASRAIRQAEVGASQTMIEWTEACFGIKPAWLAGDTAYGSAPNLDWLVNQQGIAPHVPVIDKSQREDGHVLARGLHLRRGARHLYMPGGQDADDDGPRQPRSLAPVSRLRAAVSCLPAQSEVLPQKCRRDGSNATSMRPHAMSLGPSPKRRRSRNHAVIARRSRCCPPNDRKVLGV
jgi:transposase